MSDNGQQQRPDGYRIMFVCKADASHTVNVDLRIPPNATAVAVPFMCCARCVGLPPMQPLQPQPIEQPRIVKPTMVMPNQRKVM